MKKSRSTNEQIAFALKQTESKTTAVEFRRMLGVSQQSFFRWQK